MNELMRRSRIIVADGAMGTELQAAGLEPGDCGELWNVDAPQRVTAVHASYIDAGAEVLLTNTFGASRIALERHGLQERTEEINTAGALIAGRAAGERAWVLGDIGPFGGFIEPLGDVPRDVVYDAFYEQAKALLAGFVDGIIIETMSDLDEVEIAVRAARAAGAKLIIGSVSFEATRVGLRTMTGATPFTAAEHLCWLDVEILATNCGTRLTGSDYAEIVRAYRVVSPTAPIFVKMNAGSPTLVGAQTVYDLSETRFSDDAHLVLDAGADIIGGCCGTGPQHIGALSTHLSKSIISI